MLASCFPIVVASFHYGNELATGSKIRGMSKPVGLNIRAQFRTKEDLKKIPIKQIEWMKYLLKKHFKGGISS